MSPYPGLEPFIVQAPTVLGIPPVEFPYTARSRQRISSSPYGYVSLTCRAIPPACGPSYKWIGEEPGSSHTATQCSSQAASPAQGGPQPPRALSGSPEPARGAWLGPAP